MYKIKNKHLPSWKPKLFQMRANKHNVNYKTNNKRNYCYEFRQHCATLSKLKHPKKTTRPKKHMDLQKQNIYTGSSLSSYFCCLSVMSVTFPLSLLSFCCAFSFIYSVNSNLLFLNIKWGIPLLKKTKQKHLYDQQKTCCLCHLARAVV